MLIEEFNGFWLPRDSASLVTNEIQDREPHVRCDSLRVARLEAVTMRNHP
jgi:hypothetical protein